MAHIRLVGHRPAKLLRCNTDFTNFPASSLPATIPVWAFHNAHQRPALKLPLNRRLGHSIRGHISHSASASLASRFPAVTMEGVVADTKQDTSTSSCLHDSEIVKSEEDKKSYRMVTLDNGLVALLIHDPEIAAMMMAQRDSSEVKAGEAPADGKGGTANQNVEITEVVPAGGSGGGKVGALAEEDTESDDEWETDSGGDEVMGEGDDEAGEKGLRLKSSRHGEVGEAVARKGRGKGARTKAGSGGVKLGGRRKREKQLSGNQKTGMKGDESEEVDEAGEEEEDEEEEGADEDSDVEDDENDEGSDEEDGEEEDDAEEEEGGTKQHGAQQATKKVGVERCD